MGILNEQLLGGGTPAGTDINPFPQPPEREVPSLGFGGYTYAHDTTQEELFNTTSVTERLGPVGDVPLGVGLQYGPVGRRIGETHTTILGQMAKVLKPRAEDDAEPTWSTGAKMGHTFTSSGARKSFKDRTVTGSVPNASGGYSGGFDANNIYGITNWISTGGTGIEATAEVQEVSVPWTDPATGKRNEATKGEGAGRHKGNWGSENDGDFVTVEAAAAVAAVQQPESFRSGGSSTGLRNMPAAPTS